MEVGGIAAQLGTLQAGRGGGPREGEEETEEVGAWGVMRVEVAVGKRGRWRSMEGRVRWFTVGGGDAQHVLVVVGKGGDEVGVGACREGGVQVLVCRRREKLPAERMRLPIQAGRRSGPRLQLQFSLGAGAVYEVQATAEIVHALAHVVQRHGKPERAVGSDVDRGGAEQREPVSLFGMFGGWLGVGAEGGHRNTS